MKNSIRFLLGGYLGVFLISTFIVVQSNNIRTSSIDAARTKESKKCVGYTILDHNLIRICNGDTVAVAASTVKVDVPR